MAIKCFKCGKGIADDNYSLNFYPIEPKGAPDRKWVCDKCMSKSIQLKQLAKHIWDTKGR